MRPMAAFPCTEWHRERLWCQASPVREHARERPSHLAATVLLGALHGTPRHGHRPRRRHRRSSRPRSPAIRNDECCHEHFLLPLSIKTQCLLKQPGFQNGCTKRISPACSLVFLVLPPPTPPTHRNALTRGFGCTCAHVSAGYPLGSESLDSNKYTHVLRQCYPTL